MYFMGAISFLADPTILVKNCLSLTALYKVFVGYGHLYCYYCYSKLQKIAKLYSIKQRNYCIKCYFLLLQCKKRTLVNSNDH